MNPTPNPTPYPSVSPTKQPSPSPTKQPNRTPSEDPSISPSKRPSSLPTKQPNGAPSDDPSISPTKQPSMLQTQKPSNVPSFGPTEDGGGGGITLNPTNAPIPRRPTTSDSESPTTVPSNECSDNENYTSPINSGYGCELYDCPNYDCYMFKGFMTAEELQDLFTSCPQTCGVPCDFEPVLPSAPPSLSATPSTAPTSSEPSVHPTPGCNDNEDYESPINGNFGCEFHDGAIVGCADFGLILSNEEIEELLINCPETCGVPCDFETVLPSAPPSLSATPSTAPSSSTPYPSVSPTKQPSPSPTKQPNRTPSEDPSISPSKRPSSLPTKQPNGAPSDDPSISPTKQPSMLQTQKPSNVPSFGPTEDGGGGGITLNPTNAPIPRRPTTSDSESPTTVPSNECSDNENYTSPINSGYGCELYDCPNYDCYMFKGFMTAEELQDLFTSCPQTCGVPCDFEPVLPSAPPSLSATPSTAPTSSEPSVHPTPGCNDNEDYESPINGNFGCEFHDGAIVGCADFGLILSNEEIEELLINCPEACGTCE